jgi:putative MATE family efflux protein
LGTERIGKLLWQYSIPSVIAMTASSLYNITDSIFIGRGVNSTALGALAIAFPLMNLAAAFGSLVGVGAATLMSLRLGQKDYGSANNILGNVLSLNLILGTLYTVLTLLFLDPLLRFFGASDEMMPYAHDYMVIISIGNVISHTFFGLNAMLRSTGSPQKAMSATIAAVVLNAVLAYLFIFVFRWGIKGAGWATVSAQFILLLWQLWLFTRPNQFVRLQRKFLRPSRKIASASIPIGLSPFLINSVSCVIIAAIDRQLTHYGGDISVTAYGIVNRYATLFVMVVFGFNMAMQPIAGYNYGAQQYGRVNATLRITIFMATCVMTLGFVVAQLFPEQVSRVFTDHDEVVSQTAHALRIVMLIAPLVGFQVVTTNFFQSIGKPGKSIFLSLTRQVLFLLPGLIILPRFFATDGVWYSIPIADSIACIVAAVMLIMHYRKYKANLI